MTIWWLLLGAALGIIAMIPVVRLLLRRAEHRTRQAERRARSAERLAELGSMTGGLAHEIKNPLSTIGLNADLLAEALAEADVPEDQRERLGRRLRSLKEEVQRLSGVLTDFLQFAGRVKLDPQPRNIVRIVEELCDFFHPQCAQEHILLRTQFPDHPVWVRVDEGLLKQALLNLMLNATQAMAAMERPASPRAGSAGELIMQIEADPREVRIHLVDTGPGIPPEQIEEIYRPYVSLRAAGTGLGLPTARRIIEEHGGRLELQSEVGRGSDFIVHLARSEAPEAPSA